MNTFEMTKEFSKWLDSLQETVAAIVSRRIQRASLGNFGDCKPVGEGVFEMRIDIGPGYRVYYARKGEVVYLLVFGGNKSTQARDIEKAKAIWATCQRG